MMSSASFERALEDSWDAADARASNSPFMLPLKVEQRQKNVVKMMRVGVGGEAPCTKDVQVEVGDILFYTVLLVLPFSFFRLYQH